MIRTSLDGTVLQMLLIFSTYCLLLINIVLNAVQFVQ